MNVAEMLILLKPLAMKLELLWYEIFDTNVTRGTSYWEYPWGTRATQNVFILSEVPQGNLSNSKYEVPLSFWDFFQMSLNECGWNADYFGTPGIENVII